MEITLLGWITMMKRHSRPIWSPCDGTEWDQMEEVIETVGEAVADAETGRRRCFFFCPQVTDVDTAGTGSEEVVSVPRANG